MDWLNKFQKEIEKPPNYAEKTLAAYQLGMRAKGAIAGVRIIVGDGCCTAANELPAGIIYSPDNAPRIPLDECSLGAACHCVYRPVMAYEVEQDE